MRNFKKYMAVMLASVALVHSTNSAFAAEWLLHTGTKLEEAKNNYDFCVGDYNNDGKLDIYAIKKSATGTGTTEVHILNGADNYRSFLLQTGTGLEKAGNNFDFCVSDYNGDGKLDIYAIKKSATGTGTTEVHILNGADNYRSFLLQTGTGLEKAGNNFDFCVNDYNGDGKDDIYALKKSATGTSSLEVHILNGKDNFQTFLLHTGTKLEEPKTNYDFCIGDYNGDGKADIYAFKKNATGTSSTEIHVLTIDGSKAKSTTNKDTSNEGNSDTSNTSSSTTKTNSKNTLLFPLRGSIKRSSNTKTNGIYCDYKANKSDGVYAPTDGTIEFKQAYRKVGNTKKLSSYGNFIVFKSSDGVYTIKFCHLSSFNGVNTTVKSSLSYPCSGSDGTITLAKKSVKQGELLGYTGMTGNASGYHLHLEVYKNGKAVNPTSVFTTWN